jgi:integrase
MTEDKVVDGEPVKGLSPRTAHYMRMVLGLVFAQAKAEGLIGLNPATRLSVPALGTPGKRVLNDAEVKKLIAYRGTRFAPLFAMMLATGLRVSEALALTEQDVSDDIITISRQLLWRKKGEWELTILKTTAAKRTIPLSAVSRDALTRTRTQGDKDKAAAKDGYTSDGLLFASESGKPMTQSNVHRALRSALSELKIPPASVHDLRRTFLTRLARVESRPQVVKAIAGHTSLATTMQFYIVSNTEDESKAVARALDGIM